MNKAAVLHIPKSQYAFAYGRDELHIRLRTARGDVQSVELLYAVKYDWLTDRKTIHMLKSFSDALFDYYAVSLKVPDSRIGYIFLIKSGDEKYYYSEEGFSLEYNHSKGYYNFFQFPYINQSDIQKKIDWLDGAVFYQIFVERFFMGNKAKDTDYIDKKWGELPTPKGFFGGDLLGITQKLDYIKKLGVTGLYLTPVFESPSNHKYDTVDYGRVDEMFGTNDDLKNLVQSAHKKGIKIVLDAVFNHCSYLCSQFQDVLKHGKASKYFDWFDIRGEKPNMETVNYECFASCANMPKWNTNNLQVQDFLLSVATKWIEQYDIDGWRLDVADEVSHEFWRRFRYSVKKAKPSAVIIGENWHDSRPWLCGDQFDSIMNYSFTKACLDFFAFDTYTAQQFCDRLSEILMRNTDQVNQMMLNLLDSHDTERFLTNAKNDKAKLKCALAVLFFFVGVPCVYYGTEIGMAGGYDPDSRRTFDWDEGVWDKDLLSTVAKLVALKKEKIDGAIRLCTCGDLFVLDRGRVTLVVNNTESEQLFFRDKYRAAVGPQTYKIIFKEDFEKP